MGLNHEARWYDYPAVVGLNSAESGQQARFKTASLLNSQLNGTNPSCDFYRCLTQNIAGVYSDNHAGQTVTTLSHWMSSAADELAQGNVACCFESLFSPNNQYLNIYIGSNGFTSLLSRWARWLCSFSLFVWFHLFIDNQPHDAGKSDSLVLDWIQVAQRKLFNLLHVTGPRSLPQPWFICSYIFLSCI